MSRWLYRVAAILFASTSLGVGSASWWGLPWTPDRAAWERKQRGIEGSEALRKKHGVDLATFQALIAQGAIVIDARPADEFAKGHLRIDGYPPVLNCDAERAAEQLDRLKQLETQQIVLYCTSLECHLAEELLLELQRLGFDAGTLEAMKLYPEGWEGIVKAGLPTATGPDTWTGYDELTNQPGDAADQAGDGHGEDGADENAPPGGQKNDGTGDGGNPDGGDGR